MDSVAPIASIVLSAPVVSPEPSRDTAVSERLPPGIFRQVIGQPKWKKRLVVRAWKQRAEAHDIVESGGIPVMLATPEKIERRKIVSLLEHEDTAELSESTYAVLYALYDKLVDAQSATISVIAFDPRARRGLIIVRVLRPTAAELETAGAA
jgi:hypothetical protein